RRYQATPCEPSRLVCSRLRSFAGNAGTGCTGERCTIRADTTAACPSRALVHAMLGLHALRFLDFLLDPAAVLFLFGFLDHVGLRAAVYVAAHRLLVSMLHDSFL